MANLDKRIDPDKDATNQDSGRVKDGVSGNTNESVKYEDNKSEDLPAGAAPDVLEQTGRTDAGRNR